MAMHTQRNRKTRARLFGVFAFALLFSLSFLISGCGGSGSGKSLPAEWSREFGGSGQDTTVSALATSDGGYLVAAITNSWGAGRNDFFAARYSPYGNRVWGYTYGGEFDDIASSAAPATDGGFFLVGGTRSTATSSLDILIVKIASDGMEEWERTVGDAGEEIAYGSAPTSDGGLVVVGQTNSNTYQDINAVAYRMNSAGGVVWKKTFGGTNEDSLVSVDRTNDGFVAAGYTRSMGAGYYDFYIVRITDDGVVLWEKTFGGETYDRAQCVRSTTDGGSIVAGYSNSFGAGNNDVRVIKLSGDGNSQWATTFGGNDYDGANAIAQTADGGYIVAGFSASFGAVGYDQLLLRLDPSGIALWSRTYGGSEYDTNTAVVVSPDGRLLAVGNTESTMEGDRDMIISRFDPSGNCPGCGLLFR